jgi:hypothetical protein
MVIEKTSKTERRQSARRWVLRPHGLKWVLIVALALGSSAFAGVSPAGAQATRTWVSGVGDDVNPCSRTAPCKTFPGAISKTARNGEINVLDSGGFGAVTIGKSITIDGAGVYASSLNAGGINGVNINITDFNADPNATVTLRNIAINGASTSLAGLNGIKIFSAKSVIIENVTVFGQRGADPNGRGLTDQRTATSPSPTLFVANSTFTDNEKAGIVVNGPITASLENVVSTRNGTGLSAANGAQVTVSNSVFSNNTFQGGGTNGILSIAAGTDVDVESTVMSGNVTGVSAQSGGTVRLSNATIVDNTGAGVSGNGAFQSFQNNSIAGNGAGNDFTGLSLTNITRR